MLGGIFEKNKIKEKIETFDKKRINFVISLWFLSFLYFLVNGVFCVFWKSQDWVWMVSCLFLICASLWFWWCVSCLGLFFFWILVVYEKKSNVANKARCYIFSVNFLWEKIFERALFWSVIDGGSVVLLLFVGKKYYEAG